MYDNEYLWARLRRKRHTFNIFKEVFLAERSSLIIIIISSIVVATAALFGAFYQRFLFLKLEDEERIHDGHHVEHPFETSGWVFFGIIMGTALLRFLVFNVPTGPICSTSKAWRTNPQEISESTSKTPTSESYSEPPKTA